MIRARTVLVAFALATLAACDPSSHTAPIPTECTRAGTQCQLADGPVGVCASVPCAEGAAPPCYRCTSQH